MAVRRHRRTPAELAASARAHERRVMKSYGLAEGEYAAMLASQGGTCAICGKKPGRTRLAVDHDHDTNAVIGLLCSRCNQAKGRFEWSVDVLRRAIAYFTTALRLKEYRS